MNNQLQEWDNGKLFVVAKYADILLENGLTTLDEIFKISTCAHVNTHSDRPVFRIELSCPVSDENENSRMVCYFKRYHAPKLKHALMPLLSGKLPTSLARREWDALMALENANIPTLIPLAYGEEFNLGMESRSFFMTVEVPDLKPLNEFVAALQKELSVDVFRHAKRKLIHDAALITRRMHEANIIHGDYFTKHIMVQGDIQNYRLYLLDLARCEQRTRVSKSDQARELAGLLASAKLSVFTPTDRLRFFHGYANVKKSRSKDRRLFTKITRRLNKLLERKKFRYFQDETLELSWKRTKT